MRTGIGREMRTKAKKARGTKPDLGLPPLTRHIRTHLRTVPLTDAGNAEAFELLYGDRFRYDHSKKVWLFWNGRYWEMDRKKAAVRAALKVARERRKVARDIADDKELARHFNWAQQSESIGRREALLQSAQSISRFATVTEEYDRNSYLLTVGNGTLDLTTGRIREPDPDDLITKAIDIPYDPLAKCTRFERFLKEIFAEDRELIRYVQLIIGYCLTGSTDEQCFFVLWGQGSNGKSTLTEIMLALLGVHATVAEFKTFLTGKRNADSPRDDLADLFGARLVKASEAPKGAVFETRTIKELTGSDTIKARHLYGRLFVYKPSYKILFVTNNKPAIPEVNEAIRRRVKLIPFTQEFKGNRRDKQMMEKLKAELPGILSWAVEGCLAWQKSGLGEPRCVEKATTEYLRESDPVGRFVQKYCEVNPAFVVASSTLYAAFTQFCAQGGEETPSQREFGQRLSGMGFGRGRGSKNVHIRKGIRLLSGVTIVTQGDPVPGKSPYRKSTRRKSRKIGHKRSQGSHTKYRKRSTTRKRKPVSLMPSRAIRTTK